VSAQLGLPFAAAHHIRPGGTVPALEMYRSAFQPSDTLPAPYSLVAVNTVCAGTDEEALRLARSGALMMARAAGGDFRRLPSPQEAERPAYSAAEREFTDDWLGNVVHDRRRPFGRAS
jgi:alkanesulfonate monooxygenase SsuD/methylene tetrahydromethanopterin reductase-like flavin-dependent oxidoreductase (luciferase family)